MNSVFTTRLIKMKDELRTFKNVDQGDRLAIAVHHDCLGANALAKISIYKSITSQKKGRRQPR